MTAGGLDLREHLSIEPGGSDGPAQGVGDFRAVVRHTAGTVADNDDGAVGVPHRQNALPVGRQGRWGSEPICIQF